MNEKIITVKLKPPITAYCPKCDYKISSKGGYPVYCPKCKSEMKSRYHPEIDFSTVSRDSKAKCYNLLGTEKSVQYYFFFPDGKRRHFTIDKEYAFDIDGMTPLEVAEEALQIYKEKYLWSSRIKDIEELAGKLKSLKGYEKKKRRYDIQVLKEKLYWLILKE